MKPTTSTGWWGIPGQTDGGRNSRVHAVQDGKPVCGQIFHPLAEFQWCCDGFVRRYIECEKCKHILDQAAGNQKLQAETAMTKGEAVEEVDRVRDNLARIQQELGRLQERLRKARLAIISTNKQKRKTDARNQNPKR